MAFLAQSLGVSMIEKFSYLASQVLSLPFVFLGLVTGDGSDGLLGLSCDLVL